MLVAALSVTEIEVLRALWDGKKVAEIAKERFVCDKTIESQRRNLFLKAGVTSLATLFRWGLKKGYIQP